MPTDTHPGSPAGQTAQEALMTTPITPAVRFDVDRQRQSLPADSLLRRALDKAQHIESRPHNYTEPMLRWAEQLMTDTYAGRYAGLDEQAEHAAAAGWIEAPRREVDAYKAGDECEGGCPVYTD